MCRILKSLPEWLTLDRSWNLGTKDDTIFRLTRQNPFPSNVRLLYILRNFRLWLYVKNKTVGEEVLVKRKVQDQSQFLNRCWKKMSLNYLLWCHSVLNPATKTSMLGLWGQTWGFTTACLMLAFCMLLAQLITVNTFFSGETIAWNYRLCKLTQRMSSSLVTCNANIYQGASI